jgi:hypothetical protein
MPLLGVSRISSLKHSYLIFVGEPIFLSNFSCVLTVPSILGKRLSLERGYCHFGPFKGTWVFWWLYGY